MTDPRDVARNALEDIEAATADAFDALDKWDYDRLRRAFADIAAHVEAWQKPGSSDPSLEHEELNVPRGYRMAPTESEPDRISRIAPHAHEPEQGNGSLS